MEQFYPFFLALFAGVFFSMFSRKAHIPWVVALIAGGVILGPNFLNILELNMTMEFIGQIGLIFLMFMAGLETKLSSLDGFKGKLVFLAVINGLVPFVVGVGIATLLGYGLLPALILGVVFISSSIAVVVPSLESYSILNTKIGQYVVMTTIMQDVASLVALSLILQNVSPITALPLYIFYPLLVLTLVLLRIIINIVRAYFKMVIRDKPDFFQFEFRSTFLILIGTVIVFEFLGLHPIVAGFFSGLMLSGSINDSKLKEKIRTISYGVFIPVFFIVIGLQTDLSVFKNVENVTFIVSVIILGSILSKFVSGWTAARMVGFNNNESLLFAVTSIPQLSTTLATASAAFALGLIDQVLLTALVMLSIVTVIVSPILMSLFSRKIMNHKDVSSR